MRVGGVGVGRLDTASVKCIEINRSINPSRMRG